MNTENNTENNTEQNLHKFSCRKLLESDLERVMHWRMSPHVTKFMNTDPELTMETQTKWFDGLTSSNEFYYWIIEVDGNPSGVINLADVDFKNKHCKWGYYVAEKKFRSFQLAVSLEMSLYDYAFDILVLNKVISESFCDNTAVVKIHELCHCETEGVLKRHILKNGQYHDIVVQSMFADTWKNVRSGLEYRRIEFTN